MGRKTRRGRRVRKPPVFGVGMETGEVHHPLGKDREGGSVSGEREMEKRKGRKKF